MGSRRADDDAVEALQHRAGRDPGLREGGRESKSERERERESKSERQRESV